LQRKNEMASYNNNHQKLPLQQQEVRFAEDSREQFFNKLETEQDAMVMQYIKRSTADRAYISRPRTSQYRCNKRHDNSMTQPNGLLRSSSPRPHTRKNSPRRTVGSSLASDFTRDQLKPASLLGSNTIYPVRTR